MFTEDKNGNSSLMTQKETKWSVHLEVIETQGDFCDIHTKKMETHMCDIHTKIICTQDICVTFTEGKVERSTEHKSVEL